mmetsp:Transcript_49951/g.120294  ORF Transcript_49951/g.120294 Transcript_49951/m.120294 type:complete len:100 (-) Transcript_49951:217-516(-)
MTPGSKNLRRWGPHWQSQHQIAISTISTLPGNRGRINILEDIGFEATVIFFQYIKAVLLRVWPGRSYYFTPFEYSCDHVGLLVEAHGKQSACISVFLHR